VTDLRFDVPLYTLAEGARALDVPPATLQTWARGYVRRPTGKSEVTGEPVITDLGGPSGSPTIPFIGLAEGMVLAAIRKQGVPLQRIRPAIAVLQRELGIGHALASERLYTDGAEVLYDYAAHNGDESARELVVVRHGQRVFTDIVDAYLKRVTFADDGFAERLRLPQYQQAQVIVDPRFSFGHPSFVHGRARVADALERFQAGDSLEAVALEFGVPERELEDAVRVASRRAA
jgi:uncharacterized protein (DUF433 family)